MHTVGLQVPSEEVLGALGIIILKTSLWVETRTPDP